MHARFFSHRLQRKNPHVHSARHQHVIGRTTRGREAIERQQVFIPRRQFRAAQRIRFMENRTAPQIIGRRGIEPIAFDQKKLQ